MQRRLFTNTPSADEEKRLNEETQTRIFYTYLLIEPTSQKNLEREIKHYQDHFISSGIASFLLIYPDLKETGEYIALFPQKVDNELLKVKMHNLNLTNGSTALERSNNYRSISRALKQAGIDIVIIENSPQMVSIDLSSYLKKVEKPEPSESSMARKQP